MLSRICLATWAASWLASGTLVAQETAADRSHFSIDDVYESVCPGGYLSWVKLLLIVIVFVIWVRMADWLNRDAMKIGERTGLQPELWNPINVGAFLIGFLLVLLIPLFPIGYVLYAIAAFTPFAIYFLMRRAIIRSKPGILKEIKASVGGGQVAPLPQDEGPEVDFTPITSDKKEGQVRLIRARQSGGFTRLKEMIHEALDRRADVVMLDYTRDRVNYRVQVDGVWHPMPSLERAEGDAVLVSLKNLAGVDPAQRRARQKGHFSIKTDSVKAEVELISQGVKTGERVQLKIRRLTKKVLTLGQLGMFPQHVEKIQSVLNQSGGVIVSAPPGEGLTSTWRGALATADRMSRDCVAILDPEEHESVIENVVVHRYDSQGSKRQLDVVQSMLLTQPHLIAAPTVEDSETMDLLTSQVFLHDRALLLQTVAKSAPEALLRLLAQAGDRDSFARAIQYVTCQRLVRRLCDECKQEVPAPPKLIQQLGGDPRKKKKLFRQFQPPPPEQRLDKKGNPIEVPPCPVCSGVGYIGRIAAYEILEVDDAIVHTLKTTPSVSAIKQTMKQNKNNTTILGQAYQLILLGVTSVAEVKKLGERL